jgi:hypothetical protein
MYANTSRAALDAAHLSPTARGVIATLASAAGTAAPIVNMYDLDTSSYDIDPDGRTVRIYGAAFFRTAPQDVVRFTLVLSRADLRDDEAPTWIDFDSDDLEAAGLALAEETAEAALLDALRTPGFNVAGAPAVLTTSFIDFYLPAVRDGAGSTEHIRAASGWCLFAYPSEENSELTDVYAYRRYSDDYPRCEAHGAADWADARDQLEGRVPEETLDDFERFYLENKIAWAQVQ